MREQGHGPSPHPAGRAWTVDNNNRNNPREGGAPGQGAPGPANPQAAHSTACTGRATESEAGPGPLLCDGRRGFRAGVAPRDTIAVARLSAAERGHVWRGIKRLEPALAELLRDDPVATSLRQRLGAAPLLARADYRRFLEAGRNDVTG